MKFLLIAVFLSFLGLSFSLPISIPPRNADAAVTDDADANVDADAVTPPATKEAALFGGAGGGAGAGALGGGQKVSATSVMNAANSFANDAMTVSNSLNTLPSATSAAQIKSLATTAYKAESDEDSRRSVLFSAAGSAGNTANSKIVKNTPTVLDGLKAMMVNPSMKAVQANVPTIEAARNPQILPSITQLSNSALKAVGMPQTATTFPATTGSKAVSAAKAAKAN